MVLKLLHMCTGTEQLITVSWGGSLLAVVINLRALAGKVDFNKIIGDRARLGRQISGGRANICP